LTKPNQFLASKGAVMFEAKKKRTGFGGVGRVDSTADDNFT
jgi:hypothetical protein